MPRLSFTLRRSSFIVLIPLALYFALALPQLELPGLHNDEAVEAGLPAWQILAGQPVTAFRNAGIPVGERTFPLMVQDYIGAFNVYFVLPFFSVFGPTVAALRLYTVLIGAVTLIFTFGFVAAAVSRRAAFIAALLLAVSPSFIFWQRQGVFVASLTPAFALAALWAGTRWAKSSPRTAWKWAVLLGLLCGAGLYAKLLFIWIIGGMAGALLIINVPGLVRNLKSQIPNLKTRGERSRTIPNLQSSQTPEAERRGLISNPSASLRTGLQSPISNLQSLMFPRSPSFPDLLAFTLAFLLALTPLFVYNLQTGGTLLSVGANLTTSYYGVNNLNLAGNLGARIDHFRAVIAGREHLWYLGGSYGNEFWEPALALAALVILGRRLFRRQRSRLPAALLLLLTLGIGQSSFTVSGLFPTHFSIFTPLWPCLIALASETIFNPFYEPLFIHLTGPNLSAFLGSWDFGRLGFLNLGMVILAVGLSALFARDVTVTLQYHAALEKSGGLGPHSDAIYRLIEFLEAEQKARPAEPLAVVAMDWGFAPQVQLLTSAQPFPSGGLHAEEIFGYTWEVDDGFADRLNAALDQPGALFIFHFPQETIFPRREQFDAAVRERGWQTEQLAILSRRDGAPVFEVVAVKTASTNNTKPPYGG